MLRKKLKIQDEKCLIQVFWETNRKRYISYICHQGPQSGKFHVKCKKFQFGTGIAFFRSTIKKPLPYLKSAPLNLSKCKLCAKIKILKFRPNGPFFSVFRLKFEKANAIFEIRILQFIQIPKFEQNNDNDNSSNKKWNQKMPYLGILGLEF